MSRVNSKNLAVIIGLSGVAYGIYEWKLRKWLKDWWSPLVAVGRVSQIYIHPIKSGYGRQVEDAECTELGLVKGEMRDRHWMVYDSDTKKFLTARQLPRMVLIESDVADGRLTVSSRHGDCEPVHVQLDQVKDSRQIVRVAMFDNLKTEGLDCGDAVAEWLQKFLETEQSTRLLYFVPGLFNDRTAVSDSAWLHTPVPKRKDIAVYPDLTPYMAVSEGSLDDLNSHFTDQQFDMRNFRPNIVVAGCDKFDEDLWQELRIGECVTFTCYKPCTRCVLTTVDPDTGVKNADIQPLKKLREYRLAPGKLRAVFKDSPVFGVNMGLDKKGRIQVGDTVYARYKTKPC